jgi:hypothetical protein
VAEGFVTRRSLLPTVADPGRPVPENSGARVDAIEAALCVLADEEHRLERLGLEDARQRCREARRFWGFVGALYHLTDSPTPEAPKCEVER